MYIEINLANGFIRLSKFLANTQILFIKNKNIRPWFSIND